MYQPYYLQYSLLDKAIIIAAALILAIVIEAIVYVTTL